MKQNPDREAAAKVFKALSHPSRLAMVLEAGKKERSVGELAGIVGADISTVSRHLGILTAAGILSPEKRGVSVYYKLSMPCAIDFYNCIGRNAAGASCSQRLKRNKK